MCGGPEETKTSSLFITDALVPTISKTQHEGDRTLPQIYWLNSVKLSSYFKSQIYQNCDPLGH